MPKYSCSMGDPLDLLAEECSEVIKERIKALRFGLDGCKEWVESGKAPPRLNIIKELGDVLAIVDILVEQGFCTSEQLEQAKVAKRFRLHELFG